jgi:hypothetical protein
MPVNTFFHVSFHVLQWAYSLMFPWVYRLPRFLRRFAAARSIAA